MGVCWRILENNSFNCFEEVMCLALGPICVIATSSLYKISREHRKIMFLSTRNTKSPKLTPPGSPSTHSRREETAHIHLMSVHSEG